MSIEGGIRTILVSNSGVSALVSSRVYPRIIPAKTTLPAIAYQKISGNKMHHLGGEAGHAQPTYEISCWSDGYDEAVAVSLAVMAALKDYSGTSDSTVFQWITVIGDDDAFEIDPDQEQATRFGRRIDIECFVNE